MVFKELNTIQKDKERLEKKTLVKNKKLQNDSKQRKDLLDDEKERLDGCRKSF